MTVAGRRPLLVAHRGGAGLWAENSLLAYRQALGLGVDLVECDVHLSKDGEVAVIHDPILDRTTEGRGKVRDRTMADLRRTRLKDRDGAITEEHVASLDDLAALIRGSSAGLLLEIKTDSFYARYPGIEERAVEILERHDLTRRVFVVSFDLETIRHVRSIEGSIRTGGLFSRKTLALTGQSLGEAMVNLSRLGAALVGLETPLVDESAVRDARRLGLSLAVWTVNVESEIRRQIEMGVDLLITDRPDLARMVVSGS